jgi:hypothetical protein
MQVRFILQYGSQATKYYYTTTAGLHIATLPFRVVINETQVVMYLHNILYIFTYLQTSELSILCQNIVQGQYCENYLHSSLRTKPHPPVRWKKHIDLERD